MKRKLIILQKLIGVQIRSQLQYRMAFLIESGGTFFISFLEFGSIALIFPKFGSIGGWTLGEIGLLYGTVNLSFGLMDLLFSGFDPPYFGENIRLGKFDQLLLRPINITTQVLGSRFILMRIGRILVGAGILNYAFSLSPITWTTEKVMLLILAIIGQVGYFGGLSMIGSSITFWTVDSIEILNIFTYGGTELISYPMNIYPNGLRKFFTYILPAIFLNYYPALYILDKSDPFSMPTYAPWLAPIAGILILLIAYQIWKIGVSKYQSTGT